MGDRSATVAPNILNTVDLLHRLPLMESVNDAQVHEYGLGAHLVRVPSDGGGRLRIGFRHAKAGDELSVIGPDGTVYERGPGGEVRIEIEARKRGSGWFVAGVRAPGKTYTIYALFEEVGVATREGGQHLIPWTFWYFPYALEEQDRSAWGSSVLRPLHKYEEAFGVSGVVDWELANHLELSGGKSWEGHCNTAALASIAFVPPPTEGVVHNGVDFSCEELKLLAAEVVGQYADLEDVWTPLFYSDHPGDLRSKKPSEDPELFGGGEMLVAFLEHLCRWMRMQGEALAMDLRDATGQDPEEVWNHAVFYYRTRFWQPDVDDPELTEGGVELLANADKWGDGGKATGVPAKVVVTKYREATLKRNEGWWTVRRCRFRLRFTPGGLAMQGAPDNRWLSVHAVFPLDDEGTEIATAETFAPVYSVRLKSISSARQSSVHGNPHVGREDVLALLRLRSRYVP
jgi:hypothetical protein